MFWLQRYTEHFQIFHIIYFLLFYFHWQSRNTTTQSNEPGLDIINHEKNKKSIHLFVRKMGSVEGRTMPFTYCGKMRFLDVSGNGPINVNMELEIKLNERLKQEFLRV